MAESKQQNKENNCLFFDGDKVGPVSSLDNILALSEACIEKYSLLNMLDGSVLTDENRIQMHDNLIKLVKDKKYLTVDHTPIKVEHKNGITYIYISLDNSARSNMTGHPLKDRLPAICELINKIIADTTGKCVLFFSEACRPSFDGHVKERKNEVSWFEMRNFICAQCNLQFIGEKRNNDDNSGMSFGLASFCTVECSCYIQDYFGVLLTTKSFGSVALGVKVKSGEIIWAVHFPLNFKEPTINYEVAVELMKVMKNYKGSEFALGDYNSFDAFAEALLKAVDENPEFELLIKKLPTFYPSHYDAIPNDGTYKLVDNSRSE